MDIIFANDGTDATCIQHKKIAGQLLSLEEYHSEDLDCWMLLHPLTHERNDLSDMMMSKLRLYHKYQKRSWDGLMKEHGQPYRMRLKGRATTATAFPSSIHLSISVYMEPWLNLRVLENGRPQKGALKNLKGFYAAITERILGSFQNHTGFHIENKIKPLWHHFCLECTR